MWEEAYAPPRIEFDGRDFRKALGSFPTGVCLVTTLGAQGKPEGLTINSFSSVSLDPPMVLWSLARTASCAPVFRDAEYFAVSVLGAQHQGLSSHFAKPAPDKFAAFAEHFVAGRHGLPLVAGAVATFECHSRYRNYGGDHIVLLGAVEHYAYRDGAPLIFQQGRYL